MPSEWYNFATLPANDMFDNSDLKFALTAYRYNPANDRSSVDEVISFVNSHEHCYKRSQLTGHVTASAWIMDPSFNYILLTHHAKLDRWMQLGGHIEEDTDIREAALREAFEESGLKSLRLASDDILDIDIHEIPARHDIGAHLHYDIRFFFTADMDEPLKISSESKSLKWVSAAGLLKMTTERSVIRMLEKAQRIAPSVII